MQDPKGQPQPKGNKQPKDRASSDTLFSGEDSLCLDPGAEGQGLSKKETGFPHTGHVPCDSLPKASTAGDQMVHFLPQRSPRLWAQWSTHGPQCAPISSHLRSYNEHLKSRTALSCAWAHCQGKH